MRRKRGGLLRTAARTAVISGTATSVSGRVANRQRKRQVEEITGSSFTEPGNDIVARLQQLADLKATGAINDREFAAAKAKLLKS